MHAVVPFSLIHKNAGGAPRTSGAANSWFTPVASSTGRGTAVNTPAPSAVTEQARVPGDARLRQEIARMKRRQAQEVRAWYNAGPQPMTRMPAASPMVIDARARYLPAPDTRTARVPGLTSTAPGATMAPPVQRRYIHPSELWRHSQATRRTLTPAEVMSWLSQGVKSAGAGVLAPVRKAMEPWKMPDLAPTLAAQMGGQTYSTPGSLAQQMQDLASERPRLVARPYPYFQPGAQPSPSTTTGLDHPMAAIRHFMANPQIELNRQYDPSINPAYKMQPVMGRPFSAVHPPSQFGTVGRWLSSLGLGMLIPPYAPAHGGGAGVFGALPTSLADPMYGTAAQRAAAQMAAAPYSTPDFTGDQVAQYLRSLMAEEAPQPGY